MWGLAGSARSPGGLRRFRHRKSPGATEHAGLLGTPASGVSGLDVSGAADSDTERLSSGPDSHWLCRVVNLLGKASHV